MRVRAMEQASKAANGGNTRLEWCIPHSATDPEKNINTVFGGCSPTKKIWRNEIEICYLCPNPYLGDK